MIFFFYAGRMFIVSNHCTWSPHWNTVWNGTFIPPSIHSSIFYTAYPTGSHRTWSLGTYCIIMINLPNINIFISSSLISIYTSQNTENVFNINKLYVILLFSTSKSSNFTSFQYYGSLFRFLCIETKQYKYNSKKWIIWVTYSLGPTCDSTCLQLLVKQPELNILKVNCHLLSLVVDISGFN